MPLYKLDLNKIREFRKQNKISQEEIANVIGCSQNTYSLKELGKNPITLDEAIKIANHYNKSINLFIEKAK